MSSIVLEVNLKNIRYNYIKFSKINKSVITSSVVKSDAYGLGIKKVYKTLLDAGCKDFFVATINESIELRKLNKKINIYVLNGIKKNEISIFLKYKIIPVINSTKEFNIIISFNKKLPICLHYDTGMNRLGMDFNELLKISQKTKLLNIKVKYIISHLASAEIKKDKFNVVQLKKFKKIENIFNYTKLSLCNSAGSFLSKKYHFDMIRPGISLYGGYGNKKIKKEIKSVIKLKSKIIQIKKLNKNETVGYNQTYKTNKKIYIATVGIGYADGITRLLSNIGNVYCKNQKFRILGNISMDTLVIDVTKLIKKINVGDYVEIINRNNDIEKIAKIGKTVSQNIITSLGNRKRITVKYIK